MHRLPHWERFFKKNNERMEPGTYMVFIRWQSVYTKLAMRVKYVHPNTRSLLLRKIIELERAFKSVKERQGEAQIRYLESSGLSHDKASLDTPISSCQMPWQVPWPPNQVTASTQLGMFQQTFFKRNARGWGIGFGQTWRDGSCLKNRSYVLTIKSE